MVGTIKKLTIYDKLGTSEIIIEGEIVEKYTGTVSSFTEIAINDIGGTKSVKTKYSVDYYLIIEQFIDSGAIVISGNTKHVLCSDIIKIEAPTAP